MAKAKTKPKTKGKKLPKETRDKISASLKGNQHAVGNIGGTGRPTLYKENFPELMKEYLSEAQDTKLQTPFGIKIIPNIPSIAGLSIKLGISRESIKRYYEKFVNLGNEANPNQVSYCRALDNILAEQERRLINSGLGGQYNSNIAKLLLGNHGHKEKSEVNQNVNVSLFGLAHDKIKQMEKEKGRLDKNSEIIDIS